MSTGAGTCSQRILGQMKLREQDLEEIYDKIESENIEETEEGWNEYNELPLEISTYKLVKILLSTGGPADWIEVKMNDDEEIIGMTYVFQDWFDHASETISENSYLWQYASELIERY